MLGIVFTTLVLYSNTVCCFAIQQDIIVSPDCSSSSLPDCTDLDSVLSTLRPNTNLQLQTGQHVLRQYHGSALWNLVNISLTGSSRDAVTITCLAGSGTGLAFINVTNLVIANITLDSCGLTNHFLQNAVDSLELFLDLDFMIPNTTQIGIFVAHCAHLTISNSRITNTIGLGMLAINVIGNSSFTHVNFTNNTCGNREIPSNQLYDNDPGAVIGGGAYFLYQDPIYRNTIDNIILVLSHCIFAYNAENSLAAYNNIDHPYLARSPNFTYVIGGGGGLSIFMPQVTYATVVNISHSTFEKNSARYGAGAHIGMFAGFGMSNVQFWNCLFIENGLLYDTSKTITQGGGGVAVFTDLLTSSAISVGLPNETCDYCHIIAFFDTVFTHNFASVQGGGLLAYSFSRTFRSNYNPLGYNAHITLSGCKFDHNAANYGSALYVVQFATHGADGAWDIELDNVLVSDSQVVPHGCSCNHSHSNDRTSAVDLRGINVFILDGSLTIQNNNASGIHLESAAISMCSGTSLIVEGNKAYRGGGIYMEGDIPLIIPTSGCSVVFRNNTATSVGGAVFYETRLDLQDKLDPISTVDCFLTSSNIFISDGDSLLNASIVIHFEDNEAPVGSLIYGSSLNSCSWAKKLNVSDADLLMFLHRHYNSTFVFSSAPEGKKMVSTDPRFMKVAPKDLNFSMYPGQYKQLNLSVTNVFEEEVDAVITYDAPRSRDSIVLGERSGYWHWYHVTNHSVQTVIRGINDRNFTVSLYATSTLVSTDISVNMMNCPIGFHYNTNSLQCECDEHILKYSPEVSCNPNMTVTVSAGRWLGCLDPDNCSSTHDLVFLDCYFGYCRLTPTIFNKSDTDNQCAENSSRTGVMCGQCKPGYSILIESHSCQKCSNRFLPGYIVLDVVGGLLLFACISVLGVTIDKGWTNMVILFCNIVYPYSIYNTESTSLFRYLLAPTRWISLELGIDHCFKNGVDSLQKYLIRLVFPAYLYILMGLFALLCRCSSFASRYFSPTKTLVTLLFLSYIPIIRLCAGILGPIPLTNLAGTDMPLGWIVDPNVRFCHGLHGFLFALACILAVFVVIFPFLLLCPSLAYKFGLRFKPFLDAIWAPFKPKFRSWASVRMFIRIIITMFGAFLIPPHQRNSVILNIIFLIIFACSQSLAQPFNSKLINVLDNLLVFMALLMHYASFYWYIRLFQRHRNHSPDTGELVYFILPMIIAYSVIIGSRIWYAYQDARVRKFARKVVSCCCRKKPEADLDVQVPYDPYVERQPSIPEPSLSITSDSLLQMPHRQTFSRYRESLLEDNEMFH